MVQAFSKDGNASRKAKPRASLATATDKKFQVARRTGGKFSNIRAVFSKDEKYVFLCTKSQIGVYSASSGDLARSILPKVGNHGSITSIFLHPENEYRLICVARSGRTSVWDWTDGSLIQEQIKAATEILQSLMIGTTFIWTDGKQIQMSEDFPSFKNTHKVGQMSVCHGLSNSGLSVFAYGDRSVMSFDLKTPSSTTHHEHFTTPSDITTFASYKDKFAYGDQTGAIYVYSSIHNAESQDIPRQKLHWHASTVKTLEFALNGQYLLSGGDEGVLVLWQLSSSTRQFLPRISRSINGISVSPSSITYALNLADNTVKLLNATNLELRAEIVGPRKTESVMPCVARSDSLYIGTGTDVQVWDLLTNRMALRVPITSTTFAGRARDEYRVRDPVTTLCAVHDEWMATSDCWSNAKEEAVELGYTQPQDETYLKFWKWQGTNYSLITRIDNPHGTHRVTDAVAAGHGRFISVGEDAVIKFWTLRASQDTTGNSGRRAIEKWVCSKILRFTRPQGPCKLSLSADCSVLALHTLDQTFFIHPETGTLRTTMSGLATGRVVEAGFVQNFLIILGHKRLVVWNVIKHCLAYALRIPEATTSLSLSCGDESFMVTTNERNKHSTTNAKIFIFVPTSAKPVFREKCAATLSTAWSATQGFVQITADLEIITIAETNKFASMESANKIRHVEQSNLGFSSMYQTIKSFGAGVSKEEELQQSVLNTQVFTSMFDDTLKSLETQLEDLADLVLGPSSTGLSL